MSVDELSNLNKKLSVISEMPQIIGDLNHYDVVDVQRECERSLKNRSAKEIMGLGGNAKLYHIGDLKSGVYFSAVNEITIGYFAKYSNVLMDKTLSPSTQTIRQVLIKSYRDVGGSATTGIGKMIFWDYLFPQYNCIVSDSQQTTDGVAFWNYRIQEAFGKNLVVRLANTNDKTYKDVTNYSELSDLNNDIWGPSKWFQRVIIMIMKA
jgi:hypothetical protein